MAQASTAAGLDLQNLIGTHLILLKDHIEVWKTIQAQQDPESPLYKNAQRCIKNATLMIQECANVNDSPGQQSTTKGIAKLLKRGSEDPEDQPTFKRAKKEHDKKYGHDTDSGTRATTNGTYVPPLEDASGLFTIDTNPTPIENLLTTFTKTEAEALRKEHSSKKRRRPGSEQQTAQPEPLQITEATPNEVHTAKRKKTKHEKEEQASAAVAAAEEDDDNEHVAALERKVALRLKEKDEQRQKKADKKRKRESDHSTPDVEEEQYVENNDLAEHLEPTRKPSQRRKQNLKQQLAAAKKTDPSVTMKDIKQANTNKAKKAAEATAQEEEEEEEEEEADSTRPTEPDEPAENGQGVQPARKRRHKKSKQKL